MLVASLTLTAQQITVSQKLVEFNKNKGNAYSGSAYQVNEKTLEKSLKDYFKSLDGKVSTKRHELFVEKAMIPEFGSVAMDVYVQFVEKSDTEVEISFGYYNGTNFMSSAISPQLSEKAQQFTTALLLKVTKEGTAEMLAEATKVLTKAQKEADDLADEKKKLESTISECEEKIKDAKSALEKNASNTSSQAKAIESQKIKVAEINAKLQGLK